MDAAPFFAVKIYGYCFLKFCFAVKSLLFTVPMGIPSFFRNLLLSQLLPKEEMQNLPVLFPECVEGFPDGS